MYRPSVRHPRKKPQNGAWRAYQLLLLYAALSTVSIWYYDLPFGRGMGFGWMMGPTGRPMLFPRLGFAPPINPDWWQTAIEAFNAGNPYFAYLRLQFEQAGGTPFGDALFGALRDFSIFHAVVAVLFGGYAFLRLRAVAAKQTLGLKPTKYQISKTRATSGQWATALSCGRKSTAKPRTAQALAGVFLFPLVFLR